MDSTNDFRVLELEFLFKLLPDRRVPFRGSNAVEREMVAHLLHAGMLNEFDGLDADLENESSSERGLMDARFALIRDVLDGETVEVHLSHSGRRRIFELKDQLKNGRERESFGILLDGRHYARDAKIALLDAKKTTPVAIAVFDMNGLKKINDTMGGHSVGSMVIKVYLQTIFDVVWDKGEAYRYGGDEVVVIVHAAEQQVACDVVSKILRQLGKAKVVDKAREVEITGLSACCGIVFSSGDDDGIDLFDRADKLVYAAKGSKVGADGKLRSVISFQDGRVEVILPHE